MWYVPLTFSSGCRVLPRDEGRLLLIILELLLFILILSFLYDIVWNVIGGGGLRVDHECYTRISIGISLYLY